LAPAARQPDRRNGTTSDASAPSSVRRNPQPFPNCLLRHECPVAGDLYRLPSAGPQALAIVAKRVTRPGTRRRRRYGQEPEEIEQGNPQTQGGKAQEAERFEPVAEGRVAAQAKVMAGNDEDCASEDSGEYSELPPNAAVEGATRS
jgi:hypothetical protein